MWQRRAGLAAWNGGETERRCCSTVHTMRESAAVLAAYLQSLSPAGIRWVVGAKANKDIAQILRPLLPLVDSLYCTEPPVEEAVPAHHIARLATDAGVAAQCFDGPATALAAALADRQSGEIVLVAGSLFLVAAARDYLMIQEGAEK
ncbi:MAG: hypothetical protein R2864_09990 [Syntrophotaleaceae bacterium]